MPRLGPNRVKEASENEFDHLVFAEILNNKHIDLVGDCFNVTLAYDDQNFVLIKIDFIVNCDLKRTSRKNLNSQGHGPLFRLLIGLIYIMIT